MSLDPMNSAAPLVLRRAYSASAAELVRAWTEPELLRRWFRPLGGLAADAIELDARACGALALEFAPPGAPRIRLSGTFVALTHERIEVELARDDGGVAIGPRMRVSAALREHASGTELELRHENPPPELRAELERSWRYCLGRLAGACTESLERFYARFERYPRYRSRFGGLWPDLSDAHARVDGKLALGALTREDAALFRAWIDDGYVVLRGAVDTKLVDALRAEVDAAWARGDERIALEVFENGQRANPRLAPRYRDLPHKLLDYHGVSALARDVQFAAPIRRFLEQLFERPPLAFQSLYFRFGSEQALHQDTAYVALRSPMELVGCWIALEDVEPGCGELHYHVGSHKIPEYVWFERARARPYEFDDDAEFLRHVRAESERLGCPLVRFHPKKGDVLLWHADLVHGGAQRERPELTRNSLVTHFCPLDVDPEWFGNTPSSAKLEHANGCWYCYPLR